MRLSESLRRNIMEVNVGGILNKFKGKSRRDVLFFEDILANYIKECENSNYNEKIKLIAQQWAVLTTRELAPSTIKHLPISFLFNLVLKKVWFNLGLLDDLHFIKKNNLIKMETKNEFITRIIGKNDFMIGFCKGILNVLNKSHIRCVYRLQTKKNSKYTFKIEKKLHNIIITKGKVKYDKLNKLSEIEGISLKNALKTGLFRLKENKIYFRKKLIFPVENTLFHLISNSNILLERIPYISYEYFSRSIKRMVSKSRKFTFLKNLLQIMGWGSIKGVLNNNDEIIIEIKNLPCGLQIEKDNWSFLIKTIQGYLWLINKKFNVKKTEYVNRNIIITYSVN